MPCCGWLTLWLVGRYSESGLALGAMAAKVVEALSHRQPKPYTAQHASMCINTPTNLIPASQNASQEAGCDGVELHGGNGYLIQEFLAAKTNTRTDKYGGSVAGRCTFLLELVDAVVAEVGAGRVGVKLQPGACVQDFSFAAAQLLEAAQF